MLGHTEAASQSHVARTAQHKLIISALPQLAQRNWERQSRQGDEPEISKAPYGAHGTSVCSFTGLPGSVSTWHGEVSKQHFPPLPNPGRPGRRIPTALTWSHAGASSKRGTPRSVPRGPSPGAERTNHGTNGERLEVSAGAGENQRVWAPLGVDSLLEKSEFVAEPPAVGDCGIAGQIQVTQHILWWSVIGSDQELKALSSLVPATSTDAQPDLSHGGWVTRKEPLAPSTPPDRCTATLV